MSAGEHTSDRARIEDLETQVRVLGEAHAATWERMDRINAQLETSIQTTDDRVMEIDVKLTSKLVTLDAKIQEGLGKLEQRLVALEKTLSASAPHREDAARE